MIEKSMTWEQMQDSPIVGYNRAFWELSQLEIIEIFDLVDVFTQHSFDRVEIIEEPNLVTVRLLNRYDISATTEVSTHEQH